MQNGITHVLSLIRSFITYYRIRHKLGVTNGELAIICPYGTGDTYIICTLSKILAQKYSQSIVLVIKPQHLSLVNMFRETISRVIVCEFTAKELRRVGEANVVLNNRLMIGHPSSIRKQFLFEIVGIESLNFLDCYKIYFGLPIDCQLVLPKSGKVGIRKAISIMESLHLPEGRTVLLCPSCYSSNKIPLEFWNELTISLGEAGFIVCTNVAASEENEIKGTMQLTVEFDVLIPLIESAGYVVSVRSGLCDVISSANCKKAILYPDQKWGYGTIFSCTSLIGMGIAFNIREYVYVETVREHLIQEILKYFKS